MRFILFSLLIACFFIGKAQTIEVSGEQSGIWEADTVIVKGDVTVLPGTVLFIEEGTRVIFDDYYGIVVNGGIEAVGTETDSIYFTVADTTGFYLTHKGNGAWNGIRLENCNESVVLSYCNFEYGKAIPEDPYGGALRIYDTKNILVTNCKFRNNVMWKRGGALYAENSDLEFRKIEVADNKGYNVEGDIYLHGAGMSFLKCNVKMDDMYVHGNECAVCYGGGLAFDSCSVVLDRAVINDNIACNAGGLGVQRSQHLDVVMSNVLLYNNNAVHYGGGLAVATANPLFVNFSIINNCCESAGGGGMQCAFEAHPKFYNSIIWENHWAHSSSLDGSQIWVWDGETKLDLYNVALQNGMESIHTAFAEVTIEDMLVEDPQFVDFDNNDFRLTKSSPCIDYGRTEVPGFTFPSLDLAGNQRVFNGIIDLGTYEFNDIYIDENNYEMNIKIMPNPLSSNSVCEIDLRETSDVILKLYSITGALICEKNYGSFCAGKHSLSLSDMLNTGNLKSGGYLLNVVTDYSRKVVKVVY